jgi:hypothetical protein
MQCKYGGVKVGPSGPDCTSLLLAVRDMALLQKPP